MLSLIKCTIVGDSKAHVLLMDAKEEGLHRYNNKPAENNKRLLGPNQS